MTLTPGSPSPSANRRLFARKPDYYYVPLPRLLISALRDTPLAIGVYAIIARVFRATRAAVPLSPADLRAYDQTISEGAARRALDRLTDLGYLVVVPSGGRRNAYHPSWGLVNGTSRRWDLADSALGRPRHIATEHLPQDLLDHYLGRLEPHAQRGAHVTRYVTTALLSLTDVGAYALALAGYKADRPTLSVLGLLVDGQRVALPQLEEFLALVSQRHLFDADSPIALSPAGWARLGITPSQPAAPSGRPLVFVPTPPAGHQIGQPAGRPIGSTVCPEQLSSAPQRLRGRTVPEASRSHGVTRREESTNQPQPPPCKSAAVGGGVASLSSPQPEAGQATQALAGAQAPTERRAPSPAAASLHKLGVRRDVAETLGERPLAQVERVIADARRMQGIRNIAGWVVSALRALPADEQAPVPLRKVSDRAILLHPDPSNYERLRWLKRFRDAEIADRPAILERFLQEFPAKEQQQATSDK